MLESKKAVAKETFRHLNQKCK